MQLISLFRRFLAAFFVLLLVYLSLINWQPSYDFITSLLAEITSDIVELFDMSVIVNQNLLIHQYSGHFVKVDASCTGLLLITTLWAIIFAVPLSQNQKLFYGVLVFLSVEIVNIVRISHLFYLVDFVSTEEFNWYHLYFWQLINLLLAIFIVVLLTKNNKKNNAV